MSRPMEFDIPPMSTAKHDSLAALWTSSVLSATGLPMIDGGFTDCEMTFETMIRMPLRAKPAVL